MLNEDYVNIISKGYERYYHHNERCPVSTKFEKFPKLNRNVEIGSSSCAVCPHLLHINKKEGYVICTEIQHLCIPILI